MIGLNPRSRLASFQARVGSTAISLYAALGSALAVLFLCRGLLVGRGGYQLYVDSALPAQTRLLAGTCGRLTGLWNSGNLGHRNLYPSEYPVCQAINGLLRIGIPGWLISRLLPVASLALAAAFMSLLLLRVGRRFPAVQDRPRTWAAIAAFLGVAYACGPYSQTELISSHFLYLIAIACIPIAIHYLISEHSTGTRAVISGLLIGLSFVQLQFVLIVPLVLAGFILLAGTWRLLRDATFAIAIGLLTQLPWLLPLILYPERINEALYLPSGTSDKFAVAPLNAVRQLGYVTPFAETAAGHLRPSWQITLWLLPVLALLGLVMLKSTSRVVGLACLLVATTWFVAGSKAPGGSQLFRAMPGTLAGLVRERFALTFVFVFLLPLMALYALRTVPFLASRAGPAIAALVACISALPMLNGHLAQYGVQRSNFGSEASVASYIDSHGGGTVFTVPLGSIVQGRGWLDLGRNPFSVGGPNGVVDLESSPNAAANPTIVEAANSLTGNYAPSPLGPPAAPGRIPLRDLFLLLDVHYIVIWKNLSSDTFVSRNYVQQSLSSVGAQRVFSNDLAEVYAVDTWRTRPPYGAVGRSQSLLISPNDLVAGSNDVARRWNALLATVPPSRVDDVARQAGAIEEIPCCRLIATTRQGDAVEIVEPAILPIDGSVVGIQFDGRVPAKTSLRLSDGTQIPQGTTIAWTDASVNTLIGSTKSTGHTESFALTRAPTIVDPPVVVKNQFQASLTRTTLPLTLTASKLQNTYNAKHLGLTGAGISVRQSDKGLVLYDRYDQAGLSWELPRPPLDDGTSGLTYDVRVTLQGGSTGETLSAALVVSSTRLAYASVDQISRFNDVELRATSPPSQPVYVYIYLTNSPQKTNATGATATVSRVAVTVQHQMPSMIIEASSGDSFYASNAGADSGWRLAGTKQALRLDALANSYENVWEASTSGTAKPVYQPQFVFRRVEQTFGAVLAVLLVIPLRTRVIAMRQRRRSRGRGIEFSGAVSSSETRSPRESA